MIGMVCIVQQANSFCSAPWVGMYYHSNSVSPCCTTKTQNMSPNEYLASDWLKSLKQEFIDGKKPDVCKACWVKEDQGLKSIRTGFRKRAIDPNKTTTHLEIRESNLCNFACRMCNPTDSVKIEREFEINPELQKFYLPNKSSDMTEENWNQIMKVAIGLDSINITGGEPMLMKRYYDLLDHLIDHGRNENIILKIFTNCSVYNPIFIEKMLKFKNVQLRMSIDAVGKTAEYQRYGTDWETVRANIFKFAELPIRMGIHSTITAYSILDTSSLADLFIELESYENLKATLVNFDAHVSRTPIALDYANLNVDLRLRAVREIDAAVGKLTSTLFTAYVRELLAIKKQLLERRDCNFALFVSLTKALDRIRNQSFEEVFRYNI